MLQSSHKNIIANIVKVSNMSQKSIRDTKNLKLTALNQSKVLINTF